MNGSQFECVFPFRLMWLEYFKHVRETFCLIAFTSLALSATQVKKRERKERERE